MVYIVVCSTRVGASLLLGQLPSQSAGLHGEIQSPQDVSDDSEGHDGTDQSLAQDCWPNGSLGSAMDEVSVTPPSLDSAMGLHRLDSDGPELLPYATLLSARRAGKNLLSSVNAVYEWQDAPLIFLVDGDAVNSGEDIRHLRWLLAMRGDAPYLGIVHPGRLDVYRLALDRKTPVEARVQLNTGGGFYETLVQLGNTLPSAAAHQANWISNILLKLLTESIKELIEGAGVSNEDAISLVGRALFTRFLADRDLLPPDMTSPEMAALLFDGRVAAERTSTWLNRTFNGDLLPLSEGIFQTLPDRAFYTLGNVLRRAPGGQPFLVWEEKWANLDFAHIPVGVLSQAYELYLREHAPVRQRREGSYYTPRGIADLMVRASFKALDRNGSAHTARILDPAAGAGVFLLTAFRELVAARWHADGRRPDTAVLRSILYDQIVGFDINESALRFAALGLYLMSIELDPNPVPVDKLKFKDLRGTVLRSVHANTNDPGSALGSLGPLIGEEHMGRYDLVIGNPPWSSGTRVADWELVKAKVASIAASRDINSPPPRLPNEGLDLPFVWRAMEWAKPGGQIAFALHARLLFQQGDTMPEARLALFDALNVTSVINGADLRTTKVWPGVAAPFCLLFAINETSQGSAGFRLVSPRFEKTLNAAGGMRIDTTNAEAISIRQLIDTPDVLKILYRGTKADLGLIERLRTRGYPILCELWQGDSGFKNDDYLLVSGNGYQNLRKSSRIRRTGDGLPGVSAEYLQGLPEVTTATFSEIVIDAQALPTFAHERIHDPRSADLFKGPLVIVDKSPSASVGRIGVAVTEGDAVYNQTFYGYSASGHPDAERLVRYLALILGSNLAMWFVLVTSGEFGVERETIEKATIDRIPIPDFRQLGDRQLEEVMTLYTSLQSGESSWGDVDDWVARLYELGSRDVQIITDTLTYNLPFARNKEQAQIPPSRQEQQYFCQILEQELLPWSNKFGTTISARPFYTQSISPWRGIVVSSNRDVKLDDLDSDEWQGLLYAADAVAATEIMLRHRHDQLVIGRLAQRRYWSETQARLLVQHIIWSHIDLITGQTKHTYA